MTKVISIGSDRNLFKDNSSVRERQILYGQLFDELHIVVFTKRAEKLPAKLQIAPKVWVYGTNSFSKLSHVDRAVTVAGRIIDEQKMTSENTVVTVQDPFESGLVGLKIKNKFNLPFHVQIHTDFFNPYFRRESFFNWVRTKIAFKVLKQADAIRVVSQRIADSLDSLSLKTGVVPAVLPIFVDIEKFKRAPVTVDLKIKYPQFNFIILMATRFSKEKNISLAIKVLAKVLKVYPRTGLVVVGSGPEKRRLQSLASRLQINKSVVFEEWQKDLASYYRTANMFLLTSNYEGYGLTIIESIASHCPVVSSDVGIAPVILKDGVSFVCPVGAVNCFEESISRLIENPSLRIGFVHEADSRLDQVIIRDQTSYLERYQKSIISAKRSEKPIS